MRKLASLPNATAVDAIATAVWERTSKLPVLSNATFRLRALPDVLSRHRHEESRSRLGFLENSPGEANIYPIERKTSLDPVSYLRPLHECYSELHIERPSPALALAVQAS